MSTYPTTPAYSGQQAVAAPSMPGTLKAALGVTIIAALAAIVNGIMIITGGDQLAKEIGAKAVSILTGDSVDAILAEGGGILDIATEAAKSTLETRAYMLIIPGALLLLFGLLMTKAATWARVMVTISAALLLLFAGLISLDTSGGTGTMLAMGWIATLGSIVSIVLTWLSPNGRYAKARKQRA
ncbi:MAG: hypothetical protein ABW224_24500 [Kibdelosporangium sp.]